MSDLEEDLSRARLATQILENPLFNETFSSIRSAISKAWGTSPIRDLDGQHELRLMLKALDDVEVCLRGIIDSGALAEAQIDAIRKRGKK